MNKKSFCIFHINSFIKFMLYVPCALWLDLDHVSLLTEENISLSIFFFLSFLFRSSNFSAVQIKEIHN